MCSENEEESIGKEESENLTDISLQKVMKKKLKKEKD